MQASAQSLQQYLQTRAARHAQKKEVVVSWKKRINILLLLENILLMEPLIRKSPKWIKVHPVKGRLQPQPLLAGGGVQPSGLVLHLRDLSARHGG